MYISGQVCCLGSMFLPFIFTIKLLSHNIFCSSSSPLQLLPVLPTSVSTQLHSLSPFHPPSVLLLPQQTNPSVRTKIKTNKIQYNKNHQNKTKSKHKNHGIQADAADVQLGPPISGAGAVPDPCLPVDSVLATAGPPCLA